MRHLYIKCHYVTLLAGLFHLLLSPPVSAKTIKLPAIADIWLSDANEKERNSSSGKAKYFKLKSIQEMAALRFETEQLKGREIDSARLFLHPMQPDNRLRYIRISTVNQDWKEGQSRRPYGKANGATFNHAAYATKKAWAWPGSQFCDVTFSSGHSLTSWAERSEEENGWISVAVDPKLVIALANEDTDGLAVMDGGTINPFNNYVHSHESASYAPYLLVDLGPAKQVMPQIPTVEAVPSGEHATLSSGAISIRIRNDPDVFNWRVKVNGTLLARWQVPHPGKQKWVEFSVSGLTPLAPVNVEVLALSATAHTSPVAKVQTKASGRFYVPVKLNAVVPPDHKTNLKSSHDMMRIWAVPALVKLSPVYPDSLHADLGWGPPDREENAVWDGNQVGLFGIRGEYVDFQLCVEALHKPLAEIRITPTRLHGPKDAFIGLPEIELYKNWYAKTSEGVWQPAYALPARIKDTFEIPDPQREVLGQRNQTFSVDVYIPKNAPVGKYTGKIRVSANGTDPIEVPVQLVVHGYSMPDELAFWPEMNAYHIPDQVHDFYRLAHQHRCVANFWAFRPKTQGSGKEIEVIWENYDNLVEPLLTGKAFKTNRRSGHPIECLYLPYQDSWPTPLTNATYAYNGHWPDKGESKDHLIKHYLTSPYIGDGVSAEYREAFLTVQRQFVKHFHAKDWTNTELQCFFGGKKTHRINYGSNMWWTTDEPYHWGDWLALQFFTGLWSKGRKQLKLPSRLWPARADISRPQWQGKVLKDKVNSVYYGGFNDNQTYRRCKILKGQTGIRVRAYGSASSHNKSNLETVKLVLNTWLNGADGFLVWWSTGRKQSLNVQEGCPGNALLVPGDRFGVPVVADLRLKAFRKGEQLVEYLVLLKAKYDLSRRQLRCIISQALDSTKGGELENSADEQHWTHIETLKAWQIDALRKEILKRLT